MAQRRQSKSAISDGQVDVFGSIHGLEKLVNKPTVVEANGLKVVQVVVPESEQNTPGYKELALEIARKFAPEVKSKGKPPWMDANWQAKRRMQRATNY